MRKGKRKAERLSVFFCGERRTHPRPPWREGERTGEEQSTPPSLCDTSPVSGEEGCGNRGRGLGGDVGDSAEREMETRQGKDVLVGLGGADDFRRIACSKSCTLNLTMGCLEVASEKSAVLKEYIAGRPQWSLTCECLLTDDESEMERLLDDGEAVEVAFRIGNSRAYSGKAVVSALRATGRTRELATYTIEMLGVSELTHVRLALVSCYGTGVWLPGEPWKSVDKWKNQKN